MNVETIQITPKLRVPLSEIDEFKGARRALGTLASERLKAPRRVAMIESSGDLMPGALSVWPVRSYDFCSVNRCRPSSLEKPP
jgi:hypothetical protein